ncbi:MAG: glycosyltransferase [Bacteroidetes bacterium]|nr:glycosyltransferase [Bacteroidota bacterium]
MDGHIVAFWEKGNLNIMDNIRNIKISIIIPCYNEEKFLPLLFSEINKLSVDKNDFEIILVDNGSTDRSIEIAKNNNAKVYIDAKANISKLRNIGAQNAEGKIFAFLDADCLPFSNWLEEALKYIDQTKIGLFGSIPICPHNGTWVEKVWIGGISPIGVNEVDFLCTANMFILKSAFIKVNGFNEDLLTGEDYDICQRIIKAGYKIIKDSNISVVHLRYPKTILDRFRKEIWYGEEMFNILKVNPFYKPFWASLIFGLSFFLIIICICFRLSDLILFLSLSIFLILPVISASFKIHQSKKVEFYFQLIILYFVYLAGRFFSIIKIIKNKVVPKKLKDMKNK